MTSFQVFFVTCLAISQVGALVLPGASEEMSITYRNMRNILPAYCKKSFDDLFGCFKNLLCKDEDHTSAKKCFDETEDWCFEDFGCPVPWVPSKIHDTTYFELYTGSSKSPITANITLNCLTLNSELCQTYNIPSNLNLTRPLKII